MWILFQFKEKNLIPLHVTWPRKPLRTVAAKIPHSIIGGALILSWVNFPDSISMSKLILLRCGNCGPKDKHLDMLTFISHFNSMHFQEMWISEHSPF